MKILNNLLFLTILLICLKCSLSEINVYCYYASWAADRPGNANVTSKDLDPFLCTHIFYAFLGLADDGNLQVMDNTIDIERENIKNLAALKEQNPALKLLFSVGGATAPSWTFTSVSDDPAKLQALVDSSVEYLEKFNFDGIDIDWEYPYDKNSYIRMLKALKDKFGSKYLVTTAVPYNPDDVSGYDVPAMNEILDLINVMSYDFHGPFTGKTGQNAPLYGQSVESDWQKSVLNCNASLWNWRNKGADPKKLSLGAGFYGHSFILADPERYQAGDPAQGPTKPGPYTDNPGTLGYLEICELHKNAEIIWDNEQKVPILHEDRLWVGFDNAQSLKEKVKYIKQEKISGIMIWSIETDDTRNVCGGGKWTLLNAINEEIKNKTENKAKYLKKNILLHNLV